MRISEWSSDVCSSDLIAEYGRRNGSIVDVGRPVVEEAVGQRMALSDCNGRQLNAIGHITNRKNTRHRGPILGIDRDAVVGSGRHSYLVEPERSDVRSEEHTSELQSLMRISYAVFCLKKKKHNLPTAHTCTHRHAT